MRICSNSRHPRITCQDWIHQNWLACGCRRNVCVENLVSSVKRHALHCKTQSKQQHRASNDPQAQTWFNGKVGLWNNIPWHINVCIGVCQTSTKFHGRAQLNNKIIYIYTCMYTYMIHIYINHRYAFARWSGLCSSTTFQFETLNDTILGGRGGGSKNYK